MSDIDGFLKLATAGPLHPGQVLACQECGALVLYNANAVRRHQNWHAMYHRPVTP